MVVTLLGVKVDPLSSGELSDVVIGAIAEGKKIRLAFSNPEFVIAAGRNRVLKDYLNSADYNFADGIGLVWGVRFKYGRRIERLTGTDFTEAMADISARHGYRIFLLGGKPGVADRAAKGLAQRHPGCVIAGVRDGYFSEDQESSLLREINAAQPDFLMVCLGNPKQEAWIRRHYDSLNAKVIFGNGGALDFAAGDVSRAPRFMQRMGFEWLWRLFQDFSVVRVRRQMVLPKFVLLAVSESISFRMKSS